jgi:hypothetical protein
MKILIRSQKDKEWHLVESAAYGNESALQKLLVESPSLISIDEIRPKAGPLILAVSEFPLSVGSIDLLAFTAGGDIAVIECKLAANPEVKRKVIGQVIDYGANLWEISYEDLDETVQLRMGNNLAELVKETVQDPAWDEEAFRSKVTATLESGNFILVIVVDEINDDLARIVRFINVCGSPSFEFAALEMRRFQAENAEMLVPRVVGPVGSIKTKSGSTSRNKWDEATFFEELSRRQDETVVQVARRILDWTYSKGQVWFGEGKRSGSFVPVIVHKDWRHQLFAVYTYGMLEIYFYWYTYKPPFDAEEKRRELLNKLNQIEGIKIPADALARRPSISLAELAKYGTVEQFLAVFDWVVEEIRAF